MSTFNFTVKDCQTVLQFTFPSAAMRSYCFSSTYLAKPKFYLCHLYLLLLQHKQLQISVCKITGIYLLPESVEHSEMTDLGWAWLGVAQLNCLYSMFLGRYICTYLIDQKIRKVTLFFLAPTSQSKWVTLYEVDLQVMLNGRKCITFMFMIFKGMLQVFY